MPSLCSPSFLLFSFFFFNYTDYLLCFSYFLSLHYYYNSLLLIITSLLRHYYIIIISLFLPYYFTVSYYISFSYIISLINLLFFHHLHKSPYYFNITLLLCNILYLVTIHFIGSSFKLLCNSALLCHSSIIY